MSILDGIMDGSSGRWFKFGEPGTTLSGTIEGLLDRQYLEFGTKEPGVWGDGNPKLELVVTLHTDLPREDADDDGMRTFAIKGWGIQRQTLREACLKLGRPPQIGDRMRVRFRGKEVNKGVLTNMYDYDLSAGVQPLPKAFVESAANAPQPTTHAADSWAPKLTKDVPF